MYKYTRPIHVYETDLMGVVHHSNYLRFCEEIRVDWFRQQGVPLNRAQDVFDLIVYEAKVKYKKPLKYGDCLNGFVQMKSDQARLVIQYKLVNEQEHCATVETVLCSVKTDFRIKRLDEKLIQLIRNAPWTETWL